MANVERRIILIAAVVVALLAETRLIQQEYLSGMLLYSLMLQFLLIYGAYRWEHPQRQLLVLSILPIIRLIDFSLPLGKLEPLFAQLIISIPLALTAFVLGWLLKQGFFVLRFNRHKLPRYFLLLLVGTFAGLILFQFKEPVQLERHSPILLLFYGFVLVIAMAFLEEWLFRGIMQTALMKLSDTGIAVVVVALFYTILHISWNPWPFVLLIFLMAVGLGWLRRTSDNLLDVCLVHGAANITFFLILPLLKPI